MKKMLYSLVVHFIASSSSCYTLLFIYMYIYIYIGNSPYPSLYVIESRKERCIE